MRQMPREDEGQDLPPPPDWGGRPGDLQEVRPEGFQADRLDLYEASVIKPGRPQCVPFHRVKKGDLVMVHPRTELHWGQLRDWGTMRVVTSDPIIGRSVSSVRISEPCTGELEVSDMNCEIEVIASALSAKEL